jgi:hypothetical protein
MDEMEIVKYDDSADLERMFAFMNFVEPSTKQRSGVIYSARPISQSNSGTQKCPRSLSSIIRNLKLSFSAAKKL